MTQTAARDKVYRPYRCPNCGNMLAISEKCSCDNPVTFVMMLGCRQNYLAYIDKKGNIWRCSE